ncbi:hypothetical protein Tco_0649271, partial [Tanacetum coccineum]
RSTGEASLVWQVAKVDGMVASEVAKPRKSDEHASPPYPTLLRLKRHITIRNS